MPSYRNIEGGNYSLHRKGLAVGIFILMLVVNIGSTFAGEVDVKTVSSVGFDGNTLYVGGSGPNNYSSIQEAIDDSSHGDTVFVYDESSPYYEHVIVDKSVELIGENKETTTIDGDQIGDVVTISSDQVTITGFTIERSGRDYQDQNAGIKILSNENTIAGMNITFNLFGILLSSSTGNTIVNNDINYNSYGIRLVDASTDNVISGNTLVSWSFDFNIYMKGFCNNNTISDNIITNYHAYGIYIFGSEDNIISDNTVIDCENGIILVSSNNSVITSNFFQNEEDGLSLARSTGNIISQNTFVKDGLFLYDSFDNMVTENTVNGKPLVYLEDESDITIPVNAGQILLINCDNVIIQSQDISDTNVAIELWGSEECTISQNTLTGNRRNIYLYDADFNIIEENTLETDESFIFMQTLALNYCQGNEIVKNEFTSADDYTYILIADSQQNVFSRNVIIGESDRVRWRLILSNADANTITKNTFESGGIRLASSSRNTLRDNSIFDGTLTIDWSRLNLINGNFISSNFADWGIPMDKGSGNIISRNTIENCNGAFFLIGSRDNIIRKNNIINCGDTPAWFSNSLLNLWSRNYWGQPLLRPQVIPGEIRIVRGWPLPDIVIPVFNIDMFPRKIPYLFSE